MKVLLENLGTVNKNSVTLGELEIIFSYKTPVAFKLGWAGSWVVRQNDWSTTTGKLLNQYQPDKKQRIPSSEFEFQLEELTNRLQLI